MKKILSERDFGKVLCVFMGIIFLFSSICQLEGISFSEEGDGTVSRTSTCGGCTITYTFENQTLTRSVNCKTSSCWEIPGYSSSHCWSSGSNTQNGIESVKADIEEAEVCWCTQDEEKRHIWECDWNKSEKCNITYLEGNAKSVARENSREGGVYDSDGNQRLGYTCLWDKDKIIYTITNKMDSRVTVTWDGTPILSKSIAADSSISHEISCPFEPKISFNTIIIRDEGGSELMRLEAITFCTELPCGGDPPIYQDIMVFPTPERFPGLDLNRDGDTNDTILRYQNLKTGHVVNTGLIVSGAHHAIDIYKDIIAFVGEDSYIQYYDIKTGTVGETGCTGMHPSISENIIAFASDGTIHYFDLNAQTLVDTRVRGGSPFVYQNTIVFHAFNPNSTIWLYDLCTGAAVDTGIVGRLPSFYETRVAFTTPEFLVSQDLNGDGDTNDWVIRYHNLETHTTTNTKAIGRYPVLSGNRIVFATPEKGVNQDLNGDSKIQGSVIRYYDLAAGRVVNTKKLGTEPSIYDNTITYYFWESWMGQDLNYDGDQNDPIVDTYQIAVATMVIAGPKTALLMVFLLIGSIVAHSKRKE